MLVRALKSNAKAKGYYICTTAFMRYFFFLSCLCCCGFVGFAQNDSQYHNLNKSFLQFNAQVSKQNAVYTKHKTFLYKEKEKAFTADNESDCNTTTFYMRLAANAGEKIVLQNVQTLPNGNFIASGNMIKPNEANGFIFEMNTDGTIISQKQISINNNAVQVYKLKVLLSGDVIVAGVENNSNKVFVAALANDFTTTWIKEFSVQETPKNISLDIFPVYDKEQIVVAVQETDLIVYFTISENGNVNWKQEVTVNDLVHVEGFSGLGWDSLGIVATCNSNGLTQTKLFALDYISGKINNSSIIGDGIAENGFKGVTNFNQRLIIFGAVNDNGSFKLQRNLLYKAASAETQHTYNLPETINLNSSFVLDNSGDAMGVCIPQTGKLIFLKQFSYYETAAEFATEYNVPAGSVLTSVARSFDGGFIFSLNNKDSSEAIFIKTDSVGVLADCGYKNLKVKSSELYNVQNTLINTQSTAASLSINSPVLSVSDISLSPVFNCRKNYCPVLPPQDTCLSTYFKILRTGSYTDALGQNYLMRNNIMLAFTARLDRILGEENQVIYTLKLLNEKAEYIRGKDFAIDSGATIVNVRKMSDSTIMVVSYNSKYNSDEEYTFTLISDALEIIWSKSYLIHASSGNFGDVITDGKNFYYYNAGPGYLGYKSRLTLFKLDENGNSVWLKRYNLPTALSGYVIGGVTNNSLVFVQDGDGSYGDNASYSIDKNTGKLLNAYKFNLSWEGSGNVRLLQYENNKLYYLGSDINGKLVAGLFDSTGLPLKLKVFTDYYGCRAGIEYKSRLYISLDHYEQGHFSDVLMCLDSNLNMVFANAYNMTGYYRLASTIQLSKEGNIYVSGNYSESYVYDNPFVIKYDSEGKSGTCNFTSANPKIVDVNIKTSSISGTVADSPIVKLNIPIGFVPDPYPLNVSTILCSSSPLCNTIKLTGSDALCSLNTDYTYHIKKNNGCNLQPIFSFDTAFVSLTKTTDTTVTFSFKKTGTTQLKAGINAGCKIIEDSLLVKMQKTSSNFSLGNDTVLCPGNIIYLNAGSGFDSYTWQDGSTDSVYKVSVAGKYYVHTENVCNGIYADTINVNAAVVPALYIGTDTTVCAGDTIQLNASAGFIKYDWFPESAINSIAQNASAIIMQNELIYADATTEDGCVTSDSINVNVQYAKPINLGNDTSFCANDSLVLNAGEGYSSYAWNNGNTSPGITVYNSGSYSVLAKDINGCFASDTLDVKQVYAQPKPNLGADKNICSGTTINLDAGKFVSYLWQDNSSSEYFAASASGTYWVNVTDANSCKGNDTVIIKNLIPSPSNFLTPVDSICSYGKLTLTAGNSYINYYWSTGEMQPSITIDKPGMYALKVTDADGCTGSDTVNVIPKDCMHGVYIPSAFTPNSDGKNDVFRAMVFGKAVYFNLSVYNRFGEMIFATTNPSAGWNGLVKAQPQNSGVYIWTCSYKLEGGNAVTEKGTVLLLH